MNARTKWTTDHEEEFVDKASLGKTNASPLTAFHTCGTTELPTRSGIARGGRKNVRGTTRTCAWLIERLEDSDRPGMERAR